MRTLTKIIQYVNRIVHDHLSVFSVLRQKGVTAVSSGDSFVPLTHHSILEFVHFSIGKIVDVLL